MKHLSNVYGLIRVLEEVKKIRLVSAKRDTKAYFVMTASWDMLELALNATNVIVLHGILLSSCWSY